MVYVQPGNDLARITALEMTVQAGESDSTKGELVIHPKSLNSAKDLLPKYKESYSTLGQKKAIRAGNVAENENALVLLEKFIRHIWTGIRNRVDRENLPVDVLKYYQLPLSGITPKINPSGSLIALGDAIVTGETQAVEMGYEPMANPSIAELIVALEDAKKESSEVAESDSDVDSNEASLAQLRQDADSLLKRVVNDLRYNLYEHDEPSQRRIMRRYGMTFKSDQTEPVAE